MTAAAASLRCRARVQRMMARGRAPPSGASPLQSSPSGQLERPHCAGSSAQPFLACARSPALPRGGKLQPDTQIAPMISGAVATAPQPDLRPPRPRMCGLQRARSKSRSTLQKRRERELRTRPHHHCNASITNAQSRGSRFAESTRQVLRACSNGSPGRLGAGLGAAVALPRWDAVVKSRRSM